MKPKLFKYKYGELQLPVFFPDATRAVIKTLDTQDIEGTKTEGILVNTYHLYKELGTDFFKKFEGVRNFMNFEGAVISDSGGFQINTLGSKVTDTLTPESSIEFQITLDTDMVVVLDDFTPPKASYDIAKKTVENTIEWAKKGKKVFDKLTSNKKNKPYILGVVQGGNYPDLRKYCAEELVKIGFDGFGYGGWPLLESGDFDIKTAEIIAENTPSNYFLYGLGIGKPEDILALSKMGYDIFDCVLPTRDARHKRLYVYNFDSIKDIDINKQNFYSYITPDKKINRDDSSPTSNACDCLTCAKYSKAYLAHLFKIGDFTAGRLATIHNLRFYSILMEKIRESHTP